jgi:hypothetical protein
MSKFRRPWSTTPATVSKKEKGKVKSGANDKANRFDEFRSLRRLNENLGETDEEIWEMVA